MLQEAWSVVLHGKKWPQGLCPVQRVWSISGFLPTSTQSDSLFSSFPKLRHLFGILYPEEGVSEISWLPGRRHVFFVTQEQQDSRVWCNWLDDVRAVLLLGEQSESRQLDEITLVGASQKLLLDSETAGRLLRNNDH